MFIFKEIKVTWLVFIIVQGVEKMRNLVHSFVKKKHSTTDFSIDLSKIFEKVTEHILNIRPYFKG